MKKRTLSALLAAAMAFSLSACGDQSGQADPAADGAAEGKTTVGFVVKALDDPYWMLMKAGAEDKAAELGVEVKFIAPNSESDVQGQVTSIENLIGNGINALCCAPSSPDAVLPVFERADKAGIPVLAVDTDTTFAGKKTFIGTGNESAAKLGGAYVAEQLGEGKNAVIIRGRLGDTTHDEREAGYRAALEEAGWTIIEVKAADSDAEKAMNITQDIIQRYDNIDAILATADHMAQGAQRAIEAAGSDIAVLGFNGSASAVELVLQGKMLGSVAQAPYEMGASGVENAVKAAKGETLEARIETGAEVITAENGQAYLDEISELSK